MKQRHLVFLDMNRTSSGAEYLRASRQLGFYTTFVSFNPYHYVEPGEGIADSILGYADDILTADTHGDIDALVHALQEYTGRPIDGVFASMDLELYQAAAVAKRLGIPGNAPAAVERCLNKYLMRCALQEHGVPSARFRLVDSAEEARAAADDLGFPCVLKPVNCSGSEWVRLIHDPEEFDEPIKWHKQNLGYWRGTRKIPQMLVEEFMAGPLISVETVSHQEGVHVLGLTDRTFADPPFFVVTSASFPTTVPGKDRAINVTLRALEAVGYTFGPAHTELILTSDGPKILEINPRIIGSTLSFIISKCRGYSIHEKILQLHAGVPCELDGENHGVGISYRMVASHAGRLEKVIGLEAVQAVPGVIDVRIRKRPGDEVTNRPTQNDDVLGPLTTYGPDLSTAMRSAQEGVKQLQFVISGQQAEGLIFGPMAAQGSSAHGAES